MQAADCSVELHTRWQKKSHGTRVCALTLNETHAEYHPHPSSSQGSAMGSDLLRVLLALPASCVIVATLPLRHPGNVSLFIQIALLMIKGAPGSLLFWEGPVTNATVSGRLGISDKGTIGSMCAVCTD